MTDEDAQNLSLLIGKARQALIEMDRETALGIFQDVVDIDEDSIDGWTGLGQVYYELGRLEEAEAAFKKALACIKKKYGASWQEKKVSWESEQGKPLLRCLLMLGVFYFREGDIKNAKKYLQIAANMDPLWEAPQSLLQDIEKGAEFDKLKYQNINV